MKKIITIIAIAIAVFTGLGANHDIVEARQDYYIGHEPSKKCDMYIDTDSIKRWGSKNGKRYSEATAYWTDGRKQIFYVMCISSTQEYYFNGGAGRMIPASGIMYDFCITCDRWAYDH